MGSRRRVAFTVLLTVAALLSASMLAPAFGAPKAVSAASLAKKLSRTLKIAKRADRNAKRAIAGLQNVGGPGATGPQGPAGPKGDKGEPGAAAAVGATGPQGPAGPQGPQGVKGDKGDACLSSDPACRGPQGLQGDQGIQGVKGDKGDKGDTGDTGPQGDPGPSATWINVNIPNNTSTDRAVPGWTLRFQCSGPPTHRLFHLAVPAGNGGIQLSGVKSIDDAPGSTIPFVTGSGVPNTGIVAAVGVNHPNPNDTQGRFYRMNGSFVLHDGFGSTTVTYDMFLENRGNAGTCHFRGTAVQSGLIR